MNDYQWDKKLKIHTTGREDSHADEYHFPYEATPYQVLLRLAESGYMNRDSKLIDYGCGKGRVGFFLNYKLGCSVIGIEYDELIYKMAVQNLSTYIRNQKIEIVRSAAEEFQVEAANCFYFFNPFSVEILKSVLGHIIDSYYNQPREMYLFFYYPNDDYVSYLMTMEELLFVDEIDCRDLFEGDNERERVLIFEVV